ncbi:MAG: hypothetical protein RSN88_10195 [Gordonibacter sp.]|uniref:hypothetical protein n=1 Tax=Gordonibacter sp. TaxID=1968902 RepID=UPI002FCC33E4
MPKWAVFENKESGIRWLSLVFEEQDAGHPDLPWTLRKKLDRLPVEVNAVGGYCSFVEPGDGEKYRLVEYRKYDPDENDPNTFSERVPKNHPGFSCGWIAPNGDTYSCGREGHMEAARWITDALYPDELGGERCLEEYGWIRLAAKNGWTSDYDDGVFWDFDNVPTKKQIGRLLDIGRYTPAVEDNVEMCLARRTRRAGGGATA